MLPKDCFMFHTTFDRIHIFSLQVFKVSAGCCRQARPENIRVIFCLIACLS